MTGSQFLLGLVAVLATTWFLRDRYVKGWRRPLFRRRGYDPTAAAAGDSAKGELGHRVPHGGPGAGT